MDEGDGQAAFAHSTPYSFDGVMPHVTRREHARRSAPTKTADSSASIYAWNEQRQRACHITTTLNGTATLPFVIPSAESLCCLRNSLGRLLLPGISAHSRSSGARQGYDHARS
jgi:hypothetical protein